MDADDDLYRIAKVKAPEKIDNQYFVNNKCPLQNDMIEIMYDTLRW